MISADAGLPPHHQFFKKVLLFLEVCLIKPHKWCIHPPCATSHGSLLLAPCPSEALAPLSHCPGVHLRPWAPMSKMLSRALDTIFQGSKVALRSLHSSGIPKPCCAHIEVVRGTLSSAPLCHLATKAWPRLSKRLVEAASASLQPTPVFRAQTYGNGSRLRDQFQVMK